MSLEKRTVPHLIQCLCLIYGSFSWRRQECRDERSTNSIASFVSTRHHSVNTEVWSLELKKCNISRCVIRGAKILLTVSLFHFKSLTGFLNCWHYTECLWHWQLIAVKSSVHVYCATFTAQDTPHTLNALLTPQWK